MGASSGTFRSVTCCAALLLCRGRTRCDGFSLLGMKSMTESSGAKGRAPVASKKDLLRKFLKGIETGDAMAAAVVDETRYKQHNPQTREGGDGIAALFARISKTNPKVHFARVFEDGDFAFAHNRYDFNNVKVAFEVFRFEDGRAVEHWDNIQPIAGGVNPSGRGMMDGATEIADPDRTEANRSLVRNFAETVLVGRNFDKLTEYVVEDLIQHDPETADGLGCLRSTLEPVEGCDDSGAKTTALPRFRYDTVHRVLAEGNFVLCACEGTKNGIHSGLYDLYRVADGRIAEHWNTVEAIPPREEWKNDNGKF